MYEREEEESKPVDFKVILIGDTNVGKTCVIKRYTANEYHETVSTIGSDLYKKIEADCDPKVQLNIRDTAGQEMYSGLTKNFTRESNAFLIVYSVDDQSSFDSIEKWHNDITETCVTKDYLVYLVENKVDLREKLDSTNNGEVKILIPQSRGQEKAQELNFKFASVSAKTGENIGNLFHQIAIDCLATFYTIDESPKIDINQPVKPDNNDKCKC